MTTKGQQSGSNKPCSDWLKCNAFSPAVTPYIIYYTTRLRKTNHPAFLSPGEGREGREGIEGVGGGQGEVGVGGEGRSSKRATWTSVMVNHRKSRLDQWLLDTCVSPLA